MFGIWMGRIYPAVCTERLSPPGSVFDAHFTVLKSDGMSSSCAPAPVASAADEKAY